MFKKFLQIDYQFKFFNNVFIITLFFNICIFLKNKKKYIIKIIIYGCLIHSNKHFKNYEPMDEHDFMSFSFFFYG